MTQLKILTIKPETGEVEYGVLPAATAQAGLPAATAQAGQTEGQWLIHGMVLQTPISPDKTLLMLEDEALRDAQVKGLVE
jgi:hypothetical protein